MIIKLTEGTAVKVSGFKTGDTKYVSIRKMYRKKGDTEWKHAKDGISIPVDAAKKLRVAIKKQVEEGSFEALSK